MRVERSDVQLVLHNRAVPVRIQLRRRRRGHLCSKKDVVGEQSLVRHVEVIALFGLL